jgi:hypothetical protein
MVVIDSENEKIGHGRLWGSPIKITAKHAPTGRPATTTKDWASPTANILEHFNFVPKPSASPTRIQFILFMFCAFLFHESGQRSSPARGRLYSGEWAGGAHEHHHHRHQPAGRPLLMLPAERRAPPLGRASLAS